MINNNAHFDFIDLNAIFGSESLINFSSDTFCNGISIDSRTLKSANAFVALYGEKIDGHSKIQDAFDKGAAFAVVSRKWYNENNDSFHENSFVVVDDTLIALGELANYHRLRFDIPIVAIAGSNGKTTTKDLTAAVLGKSFAVLKTYENFNNRLGVPLMLLAISDDYNAAVLELGTNEPGEVFLLAEMVAPTCGLITNIGKEHLEKLIDIDGVEMEETSLFGYLHKHQGVCFINLDDERLAKYFTILSKRFTYSSSAEANLQTKIAIKDDLRPNLLNKYDEKEFSVDMQSIGLATAYNAIAATAIGLYFNVEPDSIADALSSFQADNEHGYARMSREEIGGFTILNDCYNANPSSVVLSLKTLSLMGDHLTKTAILGDMRELGDASDAEHINVLEYAQSVCSNILVYGEEMKKAAFFLNNPKIRHFDTLEKIYAEIFDKKDNYVYLLKGSRGMKMEKLIEIIKNNLHN